MQEVSSMVNEDSNFYVFLFANPKSGSQKAKRFLDPAFSRSEVELKETLTAYVKIFNVIDFEDCEKGLKQIAELQQTNPET